MGESLQIKLWLLNSHHVRVPHDWLDECIDFIQSENQGQQMSMSQLRSLVHEQWLVSDLRELAAPCLPASLYDNPQKSLLNGSYALQMDYIIDVSVPLYSQLQKRKGTENANVNVCAETQPSQPAWAAKSTRTLLMSLTDGVNNIKAMEYKPIPALNCDLTPGIKVLIKGEILCRHGVLMVTRENLLILGGDVESLCEENSQEQLIARMLESNRSIDNAKLEKKVFQPKQSNGDKSKQGQSKTRTLDRSQGHVKVTQQHQISSVPQRQKEPASSAAEMMEFDDDDDDFLASIDEPQIPRVIRSVFKPQQNDSYATRMNNDSKDAAEWDDFEDDQHMNQVEEFLISNNASDTHNPPALSTSNALGRNSTASAFDSGFDFSGHMTTDSKIADTQSTTQRDDHNSFIASKRNSSDFTPRHMKTSHDQYSVDNRNSQKNIVPFSDKSIQPNVKVYSSGKTSRSDNAVHRTEKPKLEEREGAVDDSFNSRDEPPAKFIKQERNAGEQNVGEAVDIQQSCKTKPTGIGLYTAPFTYLSLLTDNADMATDTITIKGYISTLTSRLDHNNGTKWSLGVKVNDGTAAVDMDLSDQQLREVAKTDLEARKKLSEGMSRCQKKLITMSCLLNIQILGNDRKPQIISHRSITMSDVRALKSRHQSYNST